MLLFSYMLFARLLLMFMFQYKLQEDETSQCYIYCRSKSMKDCNCGDFAIFAVLWNVLSVMAAWEYFDF